MARKRNTPRGDSAAPKPQAEDAAKPDPKAASPEPASTGAPGEPKVVDMSVRDLLTLLGRTLPAGPPSQTISPPTLPAGVDAEGNVADLKVSDLLQLIASSRKPTGG
ncbi:MAG: hypothetical protein JO250_22630 [Armatimonadetes bacterium]|nr:hypothetical protein [Armatimonadota bacterium]